MLLNILVYVPALHEPFSTHSLSAIDWVVAVSAASTIFIVVEAAKGVAALKQRRIAGSAGLIPGNA